MNPPTGGLDWQAIAIGLGYFVMALLGFLGSFLWRDVRELRENRITREDLAATVEKSDSERDARHIENTGNFRVVREELEDIKGQQNKLAVDVERRFGQLLTEIAKIPRHSQRTDGPERRRY